MSCACDVRAMCVRCACDVRAMCEFCEWFGDGREEESGNGRGNKGGRIEGRIEGRRVGRTEGRREKEQFVSNKASTLGCRCEC